MGATDIPAALTIRGTIEFDKPAGAQIGALGIRIPNVAAHTYTTLPALGEISPARSVSLALGRRLGASGSLVIPRKTQSAGLAQGCR